MSPEIQLHDEEARELRALLKNADGALKEARRLKDLPRGQFIVVRDFAPFGQKDNFHHVRDVAELLQNDAWLQSHDGRLDSALENALLVLNAGRSLGDYPKTAMQLARMACQSVSMLICERALAQGTSSDIALAKIQNALREEVKDPLALYVMRGERVRLRQSADRSRSDDSRLESAWEAATGKKVRNYPLEVHLSTQLVEIAKLPVEQQPPAVKKLKSGIPDLSLLDPFTFKWWIERLFEPFFYAQARLRIGVVGIAVERYRLSRGKWPETPGDVAGTSLLQEVPIDPYSGQPLRYERLKDGVVVYCVGPDGTDDGGLINRTGDPARSGFDLGFQLWDVDQRRRPPPPKRVNPPVID